MPFVQRDPFTPEEAYTVGIGSQDKPDPAFVETLGAAFRYENLIGAGLSSAKMDLTGEELRRVEPGYNPFDEIEGYEEYADRFEHAYNPKKTAAIKTDIDRELEDKRTLDASGLTGFALSMGAAVLDPTILLPGGALVRSGKVGYRVGKTALTVAGAAGAATAAQEAGLQSMQQTRTKEESLMAIGGSVVLGGLLGAAGAKFFSKAEWDGLAKRLETELQDDVVNPGDVAGTIVQRMQSAGAAAVDNIKLDDLGVGGGRAAEAVAQATAALRVNPGVETMFSPSVRVREAYTKMVDNPIYSNMNMEGKSLGPDVENLVKIYQRGAMAEWLSSSKTLFKQAKKAGFEGTKSDFMVRVARAGRRGDVDEFGDEFVSRAAQEARAKIFDPLLERAKGAGLLPENAKVTTAASYVTRLWNRQKLIGEESRFRTIARRYFDEQLRQVEFKVEEITAAQKMIKAESARKKFMAASDSLAQRDAALVDRRARRNEWVAALGRLRGKRKLALTRRVPREVVSALQNIEENESAITSVKAARAAVKYDKTPALNTIRAAGGVKIGSVLDQELRAMGVTPKTRPGLFRRDRGLSDVDNFVRSEYDFMVDLPDGGNGYADRTALLDAIRDELAGNPLLSPDMRAILAGKEAAIRMAREWLEEVGLSPNAKVGEIRDFIKRVDFAERETDGFDAKVAKIEQDLEEFDAATDKLVNEREITAAEERAAKKALDEFGADMEGAIDLIDASPRIKLMLDYADAKRSLFEMQAKRRATNERVRKLGQVDRAKVTDDVAAELAAKRVDLTRLDAKIEKLQTRVEKLKPMQPKSADDLPFFVSSADRDDYLNEIVTSVFNNLTGKGNGDVPEWLVPTKRGPLKERTFNIPDELVEDFLENDMELVLRRYTRVVAADVELADKFGSPDMKDTFDGIRKEYADLRRKAKTEKERLKLGKREDRDIRHLEAFRDMMRGTYRQGEESTTWGKVTRAALTWNYIRLLGGVTLSSLADIARPLAVHGVRATMKEALPSLISGLRAARISRADARDLGAVTESVLQSRLATLADLQDPYRYGSTFERALSNASNVFSKVTGLGWWNDTMKTVASVMTQNRMAKTAMNWDGARTQDRAYLAMLGIDEGTASQIARQIKKYGVEEKGIWGANVSAWDDDFARRAWAAALNKDVDRTIVTKGVADQPLWSRSNTGKLIMQFKSFGMASHQRVLISGLQNDQHRLAEMMVLATPLGMLVSYLKFIERGDTEQAERLLDNPGLWVANGLDRTGILSIPFEISNTAEKLGAPGFVAASQAVAGDDDRGGSVSRYASRNKLGAVLGPSAGLFQDLATIAEQLSTGDLKKSGANAMIRQVPGGTLPGVRTGLHMWVKPELQDAVD